MNMSGIKHVRNNWLYILLFLSAVLLVGVTIWAFQERNQADALRRDRYRIGQSESSMSPSETLEAHAIKPLSSDQSSGSQSTKDVLTYLIEEEKLAHDVYQRLYDAWGSKVFANILNSEATHQNMLAAVMQSRDISDPRSDTLGVFTNQDLQKLYNELVARGLTGANEAYKVGVAIEELDIADIDKDLARLNAKDTDVIAVLDQLKSGSENHLKAFNRQLAR